MKKFIAAAAIASAFALSATSAFAVSCTQQGGACRAWAQGQPSSASYVAACNAEVGRCIARCKAGNKVFVGVSSQPQQYPITDCK